MTYESVKKDENILKILKEIDKQHSNIYHGMNHTLNVINNINKLCSLLNISKHENDLLKIAGLLHDIGHQTGKENHEIKSYEFAKDYLKNKINENDYLKIINAINKHHEKENIANLTLFEHILLFADKMDFSYTRINSELNEYTLEKDILEINFEIKENYFITSIKTNKLNIKDFKNWPYYTKVKKRIEEFARKLKKEPKIKIF
ncbi:MAG: HD domain-containing protein [Bacilli bacterium]|nr:HD domain-containing protein [Bacilli bacterium]